MVRWAGRIGLTLLLGALAAPEVLFAQRNTARAQQVSQQAEGGAQRNPARGGRLGVPPIGRNMDAVQLQQHIDALALVQAQQELKLTEEQQATFASKLVRLQTVRRRMTNERRRIFVELRGLIDSQTPRDEAISEKLKALNEINRRGGEDLIKSYEDLDTILTPWQRGRFRLFEERLAPRRADTPRSFTMTNWSRTAKFTRNRDTPPKSSPITRWNSFRKTRINRSFFISLSTVRTGCRAWSPKNIKTATPLITRTKKWNHFRVRK
jgi:Spy/CpxP family protein refolding chaperone